MNKKPKQQMKDHPKDHPISCRHKVWLVMALLLGVIRLFLADVTLAEDEDRDFTDAQTDIFGESGANIPGWSENASNAGGVVAILDSGTDVLHPDLVNVLWNQGDQYPELVRRGGGKYGIRFVAGLDTEADVYDEIGHGTHVAGIIGAEWNDFGVSGAANGVRLMTVSRDEAYESVLDGLEYVLAARKAGVPVVAVNLSWGGSMSEYLGGAELQDKIRQLGENGIVTLLAAGNDGTDIDFENSSANWVRNNPYVLTVGNYVTFGDPNEVPSENSNYGIRSVDVFAPGTNILSTVPLDWDGSEYESELAWPEWIPDDPDHAYVYMSGTSMATPVATGAIAILAAHFPEDSADRLAARLMGTVEKRDNLEDMCVSGGLINVRNALTQTPVPVPQQAFCSGMQVSIRGHFFGNEPGELRIGEQKAKIIRWRDTEITAEAPSGFNGREQIIRVTAEDGRTGQRYLDFTGLFGLVEALSVQGLFQLAGSGMRGYRMTALNGKLYVLTLVRKERREEQQVYEIDPDQGSCRMIMRMPVSDETENLYFQDMAACDGKLVLISRQMIRWMTTGGSTVSECPVEMPENSLRILNVGEKLLTVCLSGEELILYDVTGSGARRIGSHKVGCFDMPPACAGEDRVYFLCDDFTETRFLEVEIGENTTKAHWHSIRGMDRVIENGMVAALAADGERMFFVVENESGEGFLLPCTEEWAIQWNERLTLSSNLVRRTQMARSGAYLYILGTTPSQKDGIFLKRVQLREEIPDNIIQLPDTGDSGNGSIWVLLLLFSLTCMLNIRRQGEQVTMI